jgi:inner membrane protein
METNQNLSLLERLNEKISQSITFKLISIGILILILLIPQSMINDLIIEREARMQETIHEVTDMWSGSQTLTGPVLTIPYKAYIEKEENNTVRIQEVTRIATFLPENLKIEAEVQPEERYRGIFKVIVYTAKIRIKGKFEMPEFSEWNIPETDIEWQNAVLNIGIDDLRGIEEEVNLTVGANNYPFRPGITQTTLFTSGIHIPLRELIHSLAGAEFSVDLRLKGSEDLYFVPVGKMTEVTMNSPWADPSFAGAFPTKDKTVGKNGFTASWQVLHFNRNYPQSWTNTSYEIADTRFGVKLLVTADHYQKSMRTSKYSILIITLSFLMFFLIEVMQKLRVHAFQYILIGLGLLLFYTLLLSVSEHWGYNLAYGVSGAAVIGLISLYSYSVLNKKNLAIMLAASLTAIYGFIFIIIQIETYALLVGSIGLFVILALTMYLTRKINWHS